MTCVTGKEHSVLMSELVNNTLSDVVGGTIGRFSSNGPMLAE